MAPQVVKFVDRYNPKNVTITKEDKKTSRSAKPITLEELKNKRKLAEQNQLKQAKTKEDEEDIKNDLALDRLLSESHILANTKKNNYSGAELTLKTLDHENPIGNARVRTMESRMRLLSSTNGNASQKLEKMPMIMRKGMIKTRQKRIAKYEKEAKEAGIVLSKTKKGEFRNIYDNGATSVSDRLGTGVKKASKVRDRGLKISSVGRSTRNGLVISKSEAAKMTSSNKDRGKKGKGKRRY